MSPVITDHSQGIFCPWFIVCRLCGCTEYGTTDPAPEKLPEEKCPDKKPVPETGTFS
jgi:hypothetical protein